MIPLVNSKVARTASHVAESWWRGPVTWIVAVLALIAAIDAAYLTYTSLSHSTVAGCDVVSAANCDLVLSSPWSRWVKLPVALGGAICYASVVVLSLVAGRLSGAAGRWAGTLLVLFALLAAASGLYFTFIQLFAIGAICLHCIATHLCGLVIASLVLWMAIKNRQPATNPSQSFATIAAVPGATARRPAVATPLGPSLAIAGIGSFALLALLIGGQILFPPQTVQAEKPELETAIDMTASDTPEAAADELSPTAQTHVVNRVTDDSESPAETESQDDDGSIDEPNATASDGAAEATDEATPDAASELASEEKPDDADDKESSASDESTPPQDTKPALTREVKFLNGRVKLNVYDEAVLGSPDAPYVIIELIDYTCPHCREMHKHIRGARDRYGDQLAVIIMPVPLEMECNKLVTTVNPEHRGACRMARLALSVAKIDPEAFTDFHNYLFADEKNPPTGVQALTAAWRIVDQKRVREVWNSEPVKKRIEKYINFYSALSKHYNTAEKPFGLPVQVVGDTVFTGKFDSDEAMYEAWEKELGIKPQ